MASLTLKGVPEELLEALRCEAERERRSLNQQAILLLEQGLSHGRMSFLERLDAYHRRHGSPADGEDAETWLDVRDDEPGRDVDL